MTKIQVPFSNWRDRITDVCFECGRKYGHVTSEECLAITYHYGRCDVCLEEPVGVTDPRDFGRLTKLSYREWIYRRKAAKLTTSTGALARVGIGGKQR